MEITFDNLFSNIDPKTKNHSNLFFKIKKPSDYILPSTSPIFQCILYKKQKIIKKEKPGNYHFYDEKCLYYDLSKKSSLKGVIFFHSNAKMEMLKKSFNPKNKAINEYYGFRLSKDHSEKEFYSNDTKLMEKIYKFLRKRIFQTNFHMNYKALKQLGRGNFATVYH